MITGETLAGLNLAWMPTLSGDVQAVLATDKVRFQGQEVAFVVAESHYAARDALELIDVDYEALPPVIDARGALDDGAPLIRDDVEGRADNRIFDWEAATRTRPPASSTRPRWSSPRTSCTRGSIRRRWRRAGSSRTWTR